MKRHLLTVADVMTRDVVTVGVDTPFKAIAALLARQRISAVPVIGSSGQVLGVVSETDLVRRDERRRWGRRTARAVTAGQLMTRPAVSVESGCTLDEAARLMAARGITRLIVIDGDELVGIVARSDLLSAYLTSDEDTAARVRRDVVDRHLGSDARTVQVSVAEGVVTLTGRVAKRSTASFAERLTNGLAGVVAVRNHLTWALDDTAPAPGGIFY